VPGPVQNLPGVIMTGVRQCLASGQQNSVARHGEMQAAPGVTQTFVSGQQTSPLPQAYAEQRGAGPRLAVLSAGDKVPATPLDERGSLDVVFVRYQ